MKKMIALMLAMVMAMSLLAGCGQNKDTSDKAKSTAETDKDQKVEEDVEAKKEDDAGKIQFPLTVTDQIGNSVTLEQPAQRIVSGYYISSSACIALGLKDKFVATEEKIEARPIYKLAASELIGTVGNVGSAKAFDLEACIAAEPDLVILPKKAQDYAATLTEMDIPTIVVNPESHDDLVEMIKLIGSVAGAEEKAEDLVKYYDTTLEKIDKLTADIKEEEKPSVYMCSSSSYLSTAPKDMYQASLVASAGGKNAGDELEGDSWVDVSYEQILSMNPDIIIIPTNNMANGMPDYTAAEVLADANLAEVTAIKEGAVYNMPAGLEAWDSPVPSGVLGTLWLLATLHPEVYSMDDLLKDATEFYGTYYHFEMDPAIILAE